MLLKSHEIIFRRPKSAGQGTKYMTQSANKTHCNCMLNRPLQYLDNHKMSVNVSEHHIIT